MMFTISEHILYNKTKIYVTKKMKIKIKTIILLSNHRFSNHGMSILNLSVAQS
jgi:hypothetical protein